MRMPAQIDRQEQLLRCTPPPIENESDGVGARGLPGEGFSDRRAEVAGSVIIQQFKQTRGLVGDRFATLESGVEKLRD